MDDRLIFDNYLMILKSTVEVYVHGTLESSNDDVKKMLKHGLDETLSSQRDTYDLMTEFGWYDVNNVKNNVIDQTFKKVCKNE